MDRQEWIRQLLLKAGNELKVAAKELASNDPVLDITAWHCERACVKMLWAWLVHKGIELPMIRDLVFLLRTCREIDKDFVALRPLEALAAYDMDRQLNETDPVPMSPDRNSVVQAYEMTEYARDFVLKKIYAEN